MHGDPQKLKRDWERLSQKLEKLKTRKETTIRQLEQDIYNCEQQIDVLEKNLIDFASEAEKKEFIGRVVDRIPAKPVKKSKKQPSEQKVEEENHNENNSSEVEMSTSSFEDFHRQYGL